MKRKLPFLLLLWLFANPFQGIAQAALLWPPPDTVSFALTPVKKHTVVRGLAFGLSIDSYSSDSFYVDLKGVNLDVAPMGIVTALWGTLVYGLIGGGCFSASNYDDPPEWHVKHPVKVRGFSLSLFGMTESFNSGLILNGLAGWVHRIRGVQISGLSNDCYESKGITIAGLFNGATVAHGLQVGLINNCRSGDVVQIGLFNRIGRRVIPFVNFSFSHKKRSASDNLKR